MYGRPNGTTSGPLDGAEHLDLSQVTFIGSYGIRVLLTCHQTAEHLDCTLGISHAHERVRRVLTMTNLDDVLVLPADG